MAKGNLNLVRFRWSNTDEPTRCNNDLL